MAKKPSPEKPGPTSLLPGFQHLIPSAAAAPLAAHIRPLFLPDLVQQIARNKQIVANRREQAHPAFRKWAKDLKQGVLQQLHETQVEQDFNHVLLRGLGYTTQSDVASDQPWTLTPKWNVPGSGEIDAALGKFRLDESGRLSGEPLVMVELKGAKVDLDRKMPTRNITPVQQVWNYLNASESAQWAMVCNYAEIRLYSSERDHPNPRARERRWPHRLSSSYACPFPPSSEQLNPVFWTFCLTCNAAWMKISIGLARAGDRRDFER